MKEAIAVVGIGLRFPGKLDSADALAAFLAERRSAICDVPADRWDKDAFFHPDFRRLGRISVTRGGFLESIADFDAAFFGISPHEARRMDPQQRLVLETCFEAIEDAGMPLDRLRGRFVPVTIGAGLRDYDSVLGAVSDRVNIGATTNTGSALSIIANRVSYLFDLRGPSFAVDTACSSSLTALHYACRSIWDDGAFAALCGGVNLLLKPEPTMGFSKGGFLSPDTACKAFSADANGYVRSEGAAAVLLRPLAQALADGDRIYALIRGTALNQDGRTPGMTVPSVEAQRELLIAAFKDAGVDPTRASYVEAHGTGTPTGDPIEATAIGEVVGRDRADALYIGSVKTNLGHMECAAGMAGLIKLALTLRRRRVFPNLHFAAPNPKIPFARLHLEVPTSEIALPAEGPIFGGVNSFGFGGANGHAVLESPPTSHVAPIADDASTSVLFFSARSPSALRTLAGDLAERVTGVNVRALAAGLSRRRSRFELRAAVVGTTREELRETLAGYAADGASRAGLYEGRAPESVTQKIAFVFTGQGAQWWAMGRSLIARDPIVRGAVVAVDAELQRLGWRGASLLEELARDEQSSRMGETTIAQPAIFALQVGITRWLAQRGVHASAVVGHSIGELAAFVAAGALSLEEGARIVYWRSRCQAQAEGKGRMLAVGLTEDDARARLAPYGSALEIAAVNGPELVTIAGTHEAAQRLFAELSAQEVFCRELDVSVPFHCFLMDPIEGEFLRGLGEVARKDGSVPMYSTVTGCVHAGHALDAGYFYRNIREPVRYLHALRAMVTDGFRCFAEIGPHPALSRGTVETLRSLGVQGTIIPSLRRDGDDDRQLHALLAQLFVAGAACEATTDEVVPHLPLPRQPMERHTFWLETAEARASRLRPRGADHPHLRGLRAGAHASEVLSCDLDLDVRTQPYVGEHKVQGTVVFPAAGQLELISSLTRLGSRTSAVVLENVEFRRPIMAATSEDDDTSFRLDFYADDGSFVLVSRTGQADAPWIEHSRGRAGRIDQDLALLSQAELAELRRRRDGGAFEETTAAELYRACAAVGLELGPSFRGIQRYFHSPLTGEALAEIEAPRDLDGGFHIHPAVLDTIFQAVVSTALRGGDAHRLFLPHRVGRMKIHRSPGVGPILAYAKLRARDHEEGHFDIWAVDEAGEPIVSVEDFVVRYVPGSAQSGAAFHAFEWREATLAGPALRDLAGTWLLFANGDALGRRASEVLRASGARVLRVASGEAWSLADDGLYTVRPDSLEDLQRLVEETAKLGSIAGVAHAWCAGVATSPLIALREDTRLGAVPLGALVTALGEHKAWSEGARELWIFTSGAQAVAGDEHVHAGRGALWGLGRTLSSEISRLTTTLVDVGVGSPTRVELDALATELRHGPVAHEVALRGEHRYVHGLHARASARPAPRAIDLARTVVRAVVRTPGILDSVTLETTALPALGADELEVAVRATGLIFRDVVVGMAMLQRDAWEHGLAGAELGTDFAGVVIRVGANVREFAVGDEVMGMAARALATRVVAQRTMVRKILPGISFTEAASLPTCYLTAAAALKRLARIERGESVLIHAAAGGVGLMAVQLAHSLGARVLATTSSEEKREVLRSLGVEHIFQSRDARFRADVLAATNGEGVDVVLNSLSGQAFTESMLCLRPFGRFIDIGKTDVYRNRQIGLKVFGENRAYFCLDINRWHNGRSEQVLEYLNESMHERLHGALKLLPITQFPFVESAAALRHFAAGKHIGRIVVEVPHEGRIDAEPQAQLALASDDVFLLTGGASGFGLALARRLFERGARKLVLASRGGPKTAEDEAAISALRELGARIELPRTNVGDEQAVRELVAHARSFGRLAGVFHLAMVLDDAPISAQDAAHYARVLQPKAEGALHLHEATKDTPLDHFVLFSSVASVIGTPGQANYAAANAALDQLARARRAVGLPATSISWGIINDVGVVARASAGQRRKIESQGVRGFGASHALDLLERALRDELEHALCADVDWRRLSRLGAGAHRPGRFAHLQEHSDHGASSEPLRELLRALPESERPRALAATLGDFVAQLAGLSKGGVDIDTSLSRYGLDSLMVVQLQNFLEEQTRVAVAMVRLMKGPSLVELATELLPRMEGNGDGSGATDGWLRPVSGQGEARFRLFCFPYFGGDADAFASWAGALPDEIEVHAIDLPLPGGGREALLAGPPEDFRRALVEAIREKSDLPFAFYGHSLGGIIALDIARDLPDHARPAFVALGAVPTDEALAAFTPTALADPSEVTDAMARDAMRQLRIADLTLDKETEARVLTLVRRDLWLVYHRDPARDAGRWRGIEGVPLYLFGGARDPVPTLDKGECPLAVEDTVIIAGAHLFTGERGAREELLRHLRVHIERALAP